MARQANGLQIEGTIGNLTFYKTKNGYFIKQKSNLDKKRIQTDPAYARTRENSKEFGYVARTGKELRRALTPLLAPVYDPSQSQRFAKQLTRIKNLDFDSKRGERTVGNGMKEPEGLLGLRGFDFNHKRPMHASYRGNLDWSLQEGWLKVGPFIPEESIYAPNHATHICFQVGLLQVDWTQPLEHQLLLSDPAVVALDGKQQELDLPFALPQAKKLEGNRLLLLQVRFLEELNGTMLELGNGGHNSLQIMEIV